MSDQAAIQDLLKESFDPPEDQSVSRLALDILAHQSASPVISQVAEHNDRIVGMIIFSPVIVEGADRNIAAYILAPLAVARDFQHAGIGSALINHGVKSLKAIGVQLVFVLGDPGYYQRSGFSRAESIKPPYRIAYPDAWMVLELGPGAGHGVAGRLRCIPPLHSPEHW